MTDRRARGPFYSARIDGASLMDRRAFRPGVEGLEAGIESAAALIRDWAEDPSKVTATIQSTTTETVVRVSITAAGDVEWKFTG